MDLPNREVSYNQGMEYAMKRNFGFMEVSAKMGIGAKESLGRLVSEIYNLTTGQVDEDFSQSETEGRRTELTQH